MTTSSLSTYAAPAADPAHATAVLLVRVGVADAGYLRHGQVHVLAELLAGPDGPLADRPVQRQVVVGPVTTRLQLSGSPDEVHRALAAVGAWVREPDWSGHRAAAERVATGQGLAGGAQDVDDVLAVASLARWGRRGAGLLGLPAVDPLGVSVDDLDAWRTTYLTSANACLVTDLPQVGTDGDAVADDDWTLLDGAGARLPEQPGLPLPLPGRAPWTDRDGAVRPGGPADDPLTVLSALTRDPVTTRVLASLLRARLRTRGGARPRTRTRALPVGDRLLWLHEHTDVAAADVYDGLRSVAHGEVDDAELAATLERLAGAAEPPPLAAAERRALGELLGLPAVREVGEVSRDELVAEASETVPSVLVLADDEPGSSVAPVAPATPGGTGLRLLQKPLLRGPGEVRSRHRSRHRGGGTLVVGEHTAEVSRTLTRRGVAWDDLVAVHHLGPTSRWLVPRAGESLVVDAADWRHGDQAVAGVDAVAPSALVVRPTTPTVAIPEPEPEPEPEPAPEPAPGPEPEPAPEASPEASVEAPEITEPAPESAPDEAVVEAGASDEATQPLEPVLVEPVMVEDDGQATEAVAPVAPAPAPETPDPEATRAVETVPPTPVREPEPAPAGERPPRPRPADGGTALDAFPNAFLDEEQQPSVAAGGGASGSGAALVMAVVVLVALLATLFFGYSLLTG